jgi:methylenetetrahydrofolate dehydrogenase (NADP+) / methenyltetrahydrofolate cyclohydrolase
MRIDGKQIAQNILNNLKEKINELKKEDIVPHLAIIIVGNDPASVAYVRQKELKAKSIGAQTTILKLDQQTSEADLLKIVEKWNTDRNIHGIIVQQPLPRQINTQIITQAIDPKKDVDGFNSKSKFEMPIAMAVLEILKSVSSVPLKGWFRSRNIAIIGKGETGGKPIINAMHKLGIEPFVIDSRTKNLQDIIRNADIIISAVGKTNVVRPEMIKQGVILIGVGQCRENGKIVGDYDEEKIKDIASFYTPTPGGVGPVDVACLLKNAILAAEKF